MSNDRKLLNGLATAALLAAGSLPLAARAQPKSHTRSASQAQALSASSAEWLPDSPEAQKKLDDLVSDTRLAINRAQYPDMHRANEDGAEGQRIATMMQKLQNKAPSLFKEKIKMVGGTSNPPQIYIYTNDLPLLDEQKDMSSDGKSGVWAVFVSTGALKQLQDEKLLNASLGYLLARHIRQMNPDLVEKDARFQPETNAYGAEYKAVAPEIDRLAKRHMALDDRPVTPDGKKAHYREVIVEDRLNVWLTGDSTAAKMWPQALAGGMNAEDAGAIAGMHFPIPSPTVRMAEADAAGARKAKEADVGHKR